MKKYLVLLLISFIVIMEMKILYGDKIISYMQYSNLSKDKKLAVFAEEVVKKCADKKYRPDCYDNEIINLLPKISFEDAFFVARDVQSKDVSYGHCHILGHKLAQKEVDKDPSKWKEVMVRCPANTCNNGCLHGVMTEKFKNDYLNDTQLSQLQSELGNICEKNGFWNPTYAETGYCYHGLGHLAMYATKGDIVKSANFCDDIHTTDKSYVRSCLHGVFMAPFQFVDEEDKALVRDIAPDKTNVDKLCNQFDGLKYEVCHEESWPLFYADLKADPKLLPSFCKFAKTAEYQNQCYIGVISALAFDFAFNDNDLSLAGKYCDRLNQDKIELCYRRIARRVTEADPMLHIDKGISICNSSSLPEVKNACMQELATFSSTVFPANSKDFLDYCKKLPNEWNDKCLEEYIKNSGCDNLQCMSDIISSAAKGNNIDESIKLVSVYFQINPPNIQACHSMMHAIGQETYFHFSKNSIEKGVFDEAGMCAYGFYHGFLESLLSKTHDLKQASSFCEMLIKTNPQNREMLKQCYHGIGHGITDYYFDTEKQLQKAIDSGLETCRNTTDSSNKFDACSGGVFASVTDDINGNKYGVTLDISDPYKLCHDQKNMFPECYHDLSINILYTLGDDLTKTVAKIKEKAPADLQNKLILSVVNWWVKNNFKSEAFSSQKYFCDAKDVESFRKECIASIVQGVLDGGKPEDAYLAPANFCETSKLTNTEKDNCYTNIFDKIRMQFNGDKLRDICNKFNSTYQNRCLVSL